MTRFTTIIFYLLVSSYSHAQTVTYKYNKALIDSLKEIYLNPCIKYESSSFKEVKSKIINCDKSLLESLNKIYDLRLSSNYDEILKKRGFMATVPEQKIDNSGRNNYLYVKQCSKSKLRVFVKLIIKDNVIKEMNLILATNTKFYCTLPNGSFNYQYIDFLYLEKLLETIEFPLILAPSNTELQTTVHY